MKRLTRKLIAALMAVAILCLAPGGYAMKVSASEPVTFAVEYIEDMNEWRYQANTSVFDRSKEHREIYYLRRAIKEGDYVVVYNSSSGTKDLDLGSKTLGNLTVKETKVFTSIFCGEIENCYILKDANCAINGNVKNAYIYGHSISNFNDNVEEMTLVTEGYGFDCTVGCSGTVNHLYGETPNGPRIIYDLYAFDKDTFTVQEGRLVTDKKHYSAYPKNDITAENFDYIRYADNYPDVKSAFGYDAEALYNHFITNGVKEGRIAYAVRTNFDYERYADDYPDLKRAFGYDEKALYDHFITNGSKEGRVAYDTSNRVFQY